MGTERPNPFHHGKKPRENSLEIAIRDRSWIEAEILPNQFPQRLQVLSLRQRQARFRDVGLAQRLQNVTCGRYGFTRFGFDVAQRPLKLVIHSSEIKRPKHGIQGP